MFYQIRFQTGELKEVVEDMKKGSIPCMDVIDYKELEWVASQLESMGMFKVEGLRYDKSARDVIKEPEFECRVGFYTKPVKAGETDLKDLFYIDFYFEPELDETYDSCGEM